SAAYDSGTPMALTATPAAGSTFGGWSGACTGTGICTVTMSAAQSVTATFDTTQQFTLTVAKAGTGRGSVTSSAGRLDCPDTAPTCSAAYDSGTPMTLTATPAAGSTFGGWSGACTGTGICTVTMSAAQSVTATFTRQRFSLAVAVSNVGTGSGTVSSDDGGIANCGTSCTASYDSGTPVTLRASAASRSDERRGGGECRGPGVCTATMRTARSVTATFARQRCSLEGGDSNVGNGACT